MKFSHLLLLSLASAVSVHASTFPVRFGCNSFGLDSSQSGALTLEEDFTRWEVLTKVPNPSESTCSLRIQSNATVVVGRSQLATTLSGWILVKGTGCNFTDGADLTHRWGALENFFAGSGTDSVSGAKMNVFVGLASARPSAVEILPDIAGVNRGDNVGCKALGGN